MNATSDTFVDVEKEIHRIVWNWHRKYGGDLDELRSEAFLAYSEAYDRFDPTRGVQFSTWLWHYVHGYLLQGAVRVGKLKSRYPTPPQDSDGQTLGNLAARSGFDLKRFGSELSHDARTMLWLITDPPLDIPLTTGRRQTAGNIIDAVKDFLFRAGWSGKRFVRTFGEIQEALDY